MSTLLLRSFEDAITAGVTAGTPNRSIDELVAERDRLLVEILALKGRAEGQSSNNRRRSPHRPAHEISSLEKARVASAHIVNHQSGRTLFRGYGLRT
jgi:hypothetical protein